MIKIGQTYQFYMTHEDGERLAGQVLQEGVAGECREACNSGKDIKDRCHHIIFTYKFKSKTGPTRSFGAQRCSDMVEVVESITPKEKKRGVTCLLSNTYR
jgi:hypothetical protein